MSTSGFFSGKPKAKNLSASCVISDRSIAGGELRSGCSAEAARLADGPPRGMGFGKIDHSKTDSSPAVYDPGDRPGSWWLFLGLHLRPTTAQVGFSALAEVPVVLGDWPGPRCAESTGQVLCHGMEHCPTLALR